MNRPYIALVGRPNTGKSTLFNKLAGRRISIVENTPGVTRDRIIAEADWFGNDFFIIPFSAETEFTEYDIKADENAGFFSYGYG